MKLDENTKYQPDERTAGDESDQAKGVSLLTHRVSAKTRLLGDSLHHSGKPKGTTSRADWIR
jgi:hypothetical protein